jgi:DNA adenine methylase
MTAPLKPFLKWVGGKRWLFESNQFSLPSIKGRYFEPFLGGGAVFFENQPSNAVLSDANGRLIELYEVLRDSPDMLEKQLREHESEHSKGYYYEVRARKYRTPATRAAQFLYLNRTCFNGLYRENLSGQFNVPIGTKQTVIFASDNFGAWSKVLECVRLECRDFEASINEATKDDFIFVDPPYTVRHNTNGFVKYNQNIFAWEDQIRLRDALVRAASRGARFALTNADHESIRELYKGIGEHTSLGRHSVIAGKSSYRSSSTELLVRG